MSSIIDRKLQRVPLGDGAPTSMDIGAAGPSSPPRRSAPASDEANDFDPDELHWFGHVESPRSVARTLETGEEDANDVNVEGDEAWDCATDILYCHANHEDAGLSYEATSITAQKKFRHDLDHHHLPFVLKPPTHGFKLLPNREPYDATTWDSPTDIIYCHASDDGPSILAPTIAASTLGMIDIPALPPVPDLISSKPRKNRYGAIREPYNAATWDSPTDIIYAHGLQEDEDEEDSNDEESVQTPRVAIKGFAITPVGNVKKVQDEDDFGTRLNQLQLA